MVAGSNPVTPTNRKSLIFNRISRIFLLRYIARKMAVVHKWYINGRHPKISISVVKYLVVGRLLYLDLYSRPKQADNEFYRNSIMKSSILLENWMETSIFWIDNNI